MAVKQSLQMSLGQHLTLTPQLQQAIRLLQLSSLELEEEIQTALDKNPLLESSNEDHNDSNEPDIEPAKEINVDASVKVDSQELPDDLPIDSEWEDVFPLASTTGKNGETPNYETMHSSQISLQDHLLWQLHLTPFTALDEAVATAIIDAINENGFLNSSLEDILSSVNVDATELDLEEVETVLYRIQRFDPIGVGARNLQECLLVQLKSLANDTPWVHEAKHIITKYMHLLGNRDYGQLMRRTKLSKEQIQEIMQLIQSLNPRPGSKIAQADTQYIVPDVIIQKRNGRWLVELNPDVLPKVRINNHYASMIQRANNSSDNVFLRNNLQEARWLLKSIQSRNETLLKVATCIMEHQKEFLEKGLETMKPLVLHDIAKIVEMHESTISRVTTQKFIHTPQGVFELKYFFSSHVATDDGGECSSTAIRAMLKKLIAEENPQKPLSDNKLAKLLAVQGIQVARRTVAKYREALNIQASNERKSFFK